MSTHIVTQPAAPFLGMGTDITVHQIPAARDNFIWLVVCNATGEAAYVDGPNATPALAYAERQGIRVATILNTHTHPDHIGINRAFATRGELASMRVVGCGATADAIPGLSEAVDEGDTIELGNVRAPVWRTEGHINGHISFIFGDVLFCGDTLFAGGCGYLFDGPPATMHASLKRLAGLPPGTRVCCAHEYTEDNLRFAKSIEPDNEALLDRMARVAEARGQGRSTVPSTIGDELETNPFLRTHSATIRESLRREMPQMPLDTDADVFAAARALKDTGAYKRD